MKGKSTYDRQSEMGKHFPFESHVTISPTYTYGTRHTIWNIHSSAKKRLIWLLNKLYLVEKKSMFSKSVYKYKILSSRCKFNKYISFRIVMVTCSNE